MKLERELDNAGTRGCRFQEAPDGRMRKMEDINLIMEAGKYGYIFSIWQDMIKV